MNTPSALDLLRCSIIRQAMAGITETTDPTSGKPNARFGRKVFLSAVWWAIEPTNETTCQFRGYGDFQRWCLQAMLMAEPGSNEALVTLCRLDLVAAVDHETLMDSELHDRGAQFHCIVDPSDPGTMRLPLPTSQGQRMGTVGRRR